MPAFLCLLLIVLAVHGACCSLCLLFSCLLFPTPALHCQRSRLAAAIFSGTQSSLLEKELRHNELEVQLLLASALHAACAYLSVTKQLLLTRPNKLHVFGFSCSPFPKGGGGASCSYQGPPVAQSSPSERSSRWRLLQCHQFVFGFCARFFQVWGLAAAIRVPPASVKCLYTKQPLLLNLSSGTLCAKAAALQRALGLSPQQLWEMLSCKPGVLLFSSSKISRKWAALQQLAGEA